MRTIDKVRAALNQPVGWADIIISAAVMTSVFVVAVGLLAIGGGR